MQDPVEAKIVEMNEKTRSKHLATRGKCTAVPQFQLMPCIMKEYKKTNHTDTITNT